MGLKDMFRAGSSRRSNVSADESSPKASQNGSPVPSNASSLAARADTASETKRIAELEHELAQSRAETMSLQSTIEHLERKLASGAERAIGVEHGQPGQWLQMEERNKELRQKVRDLQSELDRVQQGRLADSRSIHETNRVYSHEEFETMTSRILALEGELEEARSAGAHNEDLLQEREQLKAALQDALDRLEAAEANVDDRGESLSTAGAKIQELEQQLKAMQTSLSRAEMAAKISEHAFQELQRRREVGDESRPHTSTLARRESPSKRENEAANTSADSVSDLEDDSLRFSSFKRSRLEGTNQIMPINKSPKRSSPKSLTGAQHSPQNENSPQDGSARYPKAHCDVMTAGGVVSSPSQSETEQPRKLSISESNSERVKDQDLAAERAKNHLLELKLKEYQQRVHELSTSGRGGTRDSSAGPTINERTNMWLARRKSEVEGRTREEIEEDIFQQKVEIAKSKLKGARTTKVPVPDLGKTHAWERTSPKPKKPGRTTDGPRSPSEKKHYGAILKSTVSHASAGLAGPPMTPRESEQARGLRTDTAWNQTQIKGSQYGFTPNENVPESSPPRVTTLAPDKVTGSEKAPWLVECHPEYTSKELRVVEGAGRSKKHFPGKGFGEGVVWLENKQDEAKTARERRLKAEFKGHYAGAGVRQSDAAGCPSDIPSAATIRIYREQYGGLDVKGEWYDNGAKGKHTAQYAQHVAVKTNQHDSGRKGKALYDVKAKQLFGPSPFGLDTQCTGYSNPHRENWSVASAPAPFGRDDQPAVRKAWAQ